MIKLAIDAMSGDLGSPIVVKACESFLQKNKDVELYVCGKVDELSSLQSNSQVHIIEANEVIGMNDGIMKIRRAVESSMNKAMFLCRDDICDAVISCGSTGGFYTSATLFLPKIEGIEKCALVGTLPTKNGKGTTMCDMGANAENTAKQLHDFAIMGNCYVKAVKGIENPKVALLNIGTEEKKGTETRREAYKLLKADPSLNFVGNIEGRELINGDVDLIVTDGFSGNIALKTCEGVAMTVMSMLKEGLMANMRSKIAAVLAKPVLKGLKDKMDYKSVGGAFMIGFTKPVIKAHGASDEVAFENAMKLACQMIKDNSIEKMKAGLQNEI